MERAVYHLATQLEALGHQPILFTRPPQHDRPFPGRVVTVPYRRFAVGGHGRVLDRTVNYPGFAARLGERLAEQVRSGEVDVIDAQGIAVLGYLRRRRRDPSLRAPVVLNPQGMEEHKTRGLKRVALFRLRRLSREAAALADRVVATDEVLIDELPRYLDVDPGRVVLLPNGVDLEEIEAVTPRDVTAVLAQALPGLGDATPVMISVGRLERYKGFADVLEALVSLHHKGVLPARWAWVVLGGGSLRAEMEARIRGVPGLGEHIFFAGWVRELPLLHAYYQRADVFVHATHYEGSSIVTLEAMAHSLAVVASRAGGIPDKVEPERSGLLVEPRDVGTLAAALERVLLDPSLRELMGREGRRRVVERFSWKSIARRTVEVYRELLGA
jgi:glycogen(starch) synthase